LARLQGARVTISGEVEEGSAYDSFNKVVKQATDIAEANVTAATTHVVKQAGMKKAA